MIDKGHLRQSSIRLASTSPTTARPGSTRPDDRLADGVQQARERYARGAAKAEA